jgi:hypothetical protein
MHQPDGEAVEASLDAMEAAIHLPKKNRIFA